MFGGAASGVCHHGAVSSTLHPPVPVSESTLMDAYEYGLPRSAIAQIPVEPRSSARLLVGPGVDDGPVPRHATVADLSRLAAAIQPRQVVPIHTDAPDHMASLFPNTTVVEDGEWWEVVPTPSSPRKPVLTHA